MSNRERKLKLFSYYAANLSIYRPEFKDQFMCPVCQRMFSRADLDASPPKISLAHAPPKAVGGRLTTLACTECDNRIGAECDRQVKYEKDAFDEFETKTVGKVTFVSAKGTRLEAEMKIDGGDIYMYNRPGMSVGQYRKIWKQISDEYASGAPFKFSIETREHKRELDKWLTSQLYAAFLVMFYHFGYEYVLTPNADSVRRVLNGEENAEKYKNAAITVSEKTSPESFSSPIVSIQTTPMDLQCFLIEISSPRREDISRIIPLPGFGESAKESYENLMKLSLETKLHFTGKPIKFNKPGKILPDPKSKGYGESLWNSETI